MTCRADVDKLPVFDPEVELGYVMNAVRTIRRELKGEVPLIGFSGSPWTLATYMVEGGSSKAFTKLKKMMYAEPATLHLLLDKLADSVILYLNAQIKAGAQSVMVFDTWGGVLTGRDYREFSLHYMHKIVDGLLRENDGRRVPVTLFTKGGGQWLEAMAATGCDALGLDWDHRHRRRASARRRQSGAAGQYGSVDAVCLPGAHRRRGGDHSGRFWPRQRPCVQPGPRHPSGCAAGARRRLRRGGTRALGEIPPLRIRCDRYGGPARRTAAARG